MRDMNTNDQDMKNAEYGLVIIVLFIVFIILTPSLLTIMYKSMKSGAELSTKGTIEVVKTLYIDGNLTKDIGLPFKVVFNGSSYKTYEHGNEITIDKELKIKNKGRLPSEGTVEINTDGTVIAKDLRFGLIKCNQTKDGKLTC
jgi:hypothetical protein